MKIKPKNAPHDVFWFKYPNPQKVQNVFQHMVSFWGWYSKSIKNAWSHDVVFTEQEGQPADLK